jgi:hypothetical protein
MDPSSRSAPGGLLTARVTVIVTVATVIGAGAGILTYLASHSVPQAMLAAGTAFGSSAGVLRQFIRTDAQNPTTGTGTGNKRQES